MKGTDIHRRFQNYNSETESITQLTAGLNRRYHIGWIMALSCFLLNYIVYFNVRITTPFDEAIKHYLNHFFIKYWNLLLSSKLLHDIFFPLKAFPEHINSVTLFFALGSLVVYYKLVLDIFYDNKRYLRVKSSFIVVVIYSWALYILLEWIFDHPLNAEIYAALMTAVYIEFLKFNKYFGWRPSLEPAKIWVRSLRFNLRWVFIDPQRKRSYIEKNKIVVKYSLKTFDANK